jgi:hypothetical protein
MSPLILKLVPMLIKTVKVAIVLLPHVLAAHQHIKTKPKEKS